jgi:hypothetical protein
MNKNMNNRREILAGAAAVAMAVVVPEAPLLSEVSDTSVAVPTVRELWPTVTSIDGEV